VDGNDNFRGNMKPTFNKITGKYEVKAFGNINEFDDELNAKNYCNKVNDWWFDDPI
jgi:hypothetical protein